MEVTPLILEGHHVRLEPLTLVHEESLNAVAADGDLWKSTVTIVPNPTEMVDYISAALEAQSQKYELPFVIIRKSTGQVVGTTRFYFIDPFNRHAEIGYTWVAASAQRTAVNTETKLLLLSHAFETWCCIRIALITDVLNQQSQAAILRPGAKEKASSQSYDHAGWAVAIRPLQHHRKEYEGTPADSETRAIRRKMRRCL